MLKLAAGVCFDGNITIDQVAGEVRTFRACLADPIGRAISQGASLTHFAIGLGRAMASLASHI